MAEENMTPVAGTEPPPANPISKPRASTLKLKPVIRKPTLNATGIGRPTAFRPGMKLPTQPGLKTPDSATPAPAAAPAPMEQLKSVTQKLKGVTQEIPQQAILHKTGIIADQDLTEAQKQAAKARTARISLSDAIGIAPVKSEAAPMKTIRIKRPVDIAKPAAAPAAAEAASAAEAPAEPKPTLTQRKTLKISRPTSVARPSGKFGVKKATETAAPAVAQGGDVADIPDVPDMPTATPRYIPPAGPADGVAGVSKGVAITGLIVQIAACVVIGLLGYYLYNDTQIPLFCGGCGWGQ